MALPSEGGNSLEKQFAQTTSCHGFIQVSNNRVLVVRGIWTLAILVSAGLLLYQTTLLTTRYLEYQAVSHVIMRKNRTMDFPAVTICNYNRFLKDRLQNVADSHGVSSDALWEFLSALFTNDDEKHYWSIKQLLEEVSANLSQSRWGWPDLRHLVIESSATVEDMFPSWLISCSWYGKNKENCRADLEPVITENGICFTFNSLVGKQRRQRRQVYSGRGKGLYVMADLSLDQYTEQPYISAEGSGLYQKGMFVAVHDPLVKADMDSQVQVVIPPGKYAYIVLRLTKMENELPPYGNCTTEELVNYMSYSQTSCYNDILTELINRTCGCVPIYRPILDVEYTTICNPQKVQVCTNNVAAYFYDEAEYPKAAEQASVIWQRRGIGKTEDLEYYCRPACSSSIYELSVSYAGFPSEKKIIPKSLKQKVAAWNLSDDETDKRLGSLTSFDINFQEMKYIQHTERPGRTVGDLIADIGGQMGLFLGASIITMAEFIEYLIRKFHRIYLTKYEKKGPIAVQELGSGKSATNP